MIYHVSDWSFVSISMDFNRQAPERKKHKIKGNNRKRKVKDTRGEEPLTFTLYMLQLNKTHSLQLLCSLRVIIEHYLSVS